MWTPRSPGRMGPTITTCICHVIFLSNLQLYFSKPGDAKTMKVKMLSVRDMKCLLRVPYVMKMQWDRHQSIFVHQWVGLSMTKWNLYGVGKLLRISTPSAWCSLKCHTILIEDKELRDRLTRLIESTTALSDPYALDIMHHYTCWMKHIHHTVFKTDDAMHL